jgi:hypothetical protein
VIELNLEMLIITRFVMNNYFSLLTGVEVSGPKIINIKQYLNINNFSSNLHKQDNFILQKYFINNSVVISIFVMRNVN